MITKNIKASISGKFKITIHNEDGTVSRELNWTDNRITAEGLKYFGNPFTREGLRVVLGTLNDPVEDTTTDFDDVSSYENGSLELIPTQAAIVIPSATKLTTNILYNSPIPVIKDTTINAVGLTDSTSGIAHFRMLTIADVKDEDGNKVDSLKLEHKQTAFVQYMITVDIENSVDEDSFDLEVTSSENKNTFEVQTAFTKNQQKGDILAASYIDIFGLRTIQNKSFYAYLWTTTEPTLQLGNLKGAVKELTEDDPMSSVYAPNFSGKDIYDEEAVWGRIYVSMWPELDSSGTSISCMTNYVIKNIPMSSDYERGYVISYLYRDEEMTSSLTAPLMPLKTFVLTDLVTKDKGIIFAKEDYLEIGVKYTMTSKGG